jgi:lysophospholipase L1-like esterase
VLPALLIPQEWHLEVEEQGESGECVLMGMKHRLQRTLDEHADAGRPYDWVLLLGGINDIGGKWHGCVAADSHEVLKTECALGVLLLQMTHVCKAHPLFRSTACTAASAVWHKCRRGDAPAGLAYNLAARAHAPSQ